MSELDLGRGEAADSSTPAMSERQQARQRVQERRDFATHVVAFVVVNTFVIVAWAVTGAGYFWPMWLLACWGVGLVLHAWNVFARRTVTEADIDAELRRHRPS